MTKQEHLFSLSKAFPTNRLTRENAERYLQALKDVPEEAFGKAAEFCSKNNQYFPSIAELRRASFVSVYGSWDEAWDEIVKKLSNPKKPRFTCPLVNEIIGSDWPAYQNATCHELGELKKIFQRVYDSKASIFDWTKERKDAPELHGNPIEQMNEAINRGAENGELDEETIYRLRTKIRMYVNGERWMLPNNRLSKSGMMIYNKKMEEIHQAYINHEPLVEYKKR